MRCVPRLAALLALALLTGCADPAPDPVEVTGAVTYDGEPVAAGIISFVPIDSVRPPGGAAISDGRYHLYPEVALKPGTYRVEVRWARATGEKRAAGYGQSPDVFAEVLPAKYNADSVLTAEVTAGGNAIDFVLEK